MSQKRRREIWENCIINEILATRTAASHSYPSCAPITNAWNLTSITPVQRLCTVIYFQCTLKTSRSVIVVQHLLSTCVLYDVTCTISPTLRQFRSHGVILVYSNRMWRPVFQQIVAGPSHERFLSLLSQVFQQELAGEGTKILWKFSKHRHRVTNQNTWVFNPVQSRSDGPIKI